MDALTMQARQARSLLLVGSAEPRAVSEQLVRWAGGEYRQGRKVVFIDASIHPNTNADLLGNLLGRRGSELLSIPCGPDRSTLHAIPQDGLECVVACLMFITGQLLPDESRLARELRVATIMAVANVVWSAFGKEITPGDIRDTAQIDVLHGLRQDREGLDAGAASAVETLFSGRWETQSIVAMLDRVGGAATTLETIFGLPSERTLPQQPLDLLRQGAGMLHIQLDYRQIGSFDTAVGLAETARRVFMDPRSDMEFEQKDAADISVVIDGAIASPYLVWFLRHHRVAIGAQTWGDFTGVGLQDRGTARSSAVALLKEAECAVLGNADRALHACMQRLAADHEWKRTRMVTTAMAQDGNETTTIINTAFEDRVNAASNAGAMRTPGLRPKAAVAGQTSMIERLGRFFGRPLSAVPTSPVPHAVASSDSVGQGDTAPWDGAVSPEILATFSDPSLPARLDEETTKWLSRMEQEPRDPTDVAVSSKVIERVARNRRPGQEAAAAALAFAAHREAVRPVPNGPSAVVFTEIGNSAISTAGEAVGMLKGLVNTPLPLVATPDIAAVHKLLCEEFPHAAEVSKAMLSQVGKLPHVRLRPVVLVGTPGCGKSTFAARMFELLGIRFQEFSCGGVADSSIAGTARKWSSSEPSLPVSLMVRHKTASPGLVLNEIGRASKSRHNGNMLDALMDMTEPTTAARWVDPYVQAPVDLSHILWVATANELSDVPAALLDRFRVVRFPAPQAKHLPQLARGTLRCIARDTGLDERWIAPLDEVEMSALRTVWKGGSLRALQRLVETVVNARDHAMSAH